MPPPSPSSLQQSMASLQNRKRRGADDLSRDRPPTKRIKSTSTVRKASNFPPQFWDNLSKIWLTPRALRELDRRNDAHPSPTNLAASSSVTPVSCARFARRGGPDLRHLRGFPEPKNVARMGSNRSYASSSRQTQSTTATSVSSKASKRSSAYDKDFEQKIVDRKIYPKGYEYPDDDSIPEPTNLDDIVQALGAPRASLSPSRFSRSTFKSFALANDRVISEGKVMSGILPTICGNSDIPNEGNLAFTNLHSITDGTTVDAVPDLYDGSYPKDIDKIVRQDLSGMIIPTSHSRAPVAPNFFVEAKAPRGGADVAKRQACLDGAIGTRAMHSLQNYGQDKPAYDGNSHTFSSTYHAGTGTLQLYAHHVTGPAGDGELPEYHMTQIDTWGMTGNIDTFRRGATAFRNARDLARRQRETFIQAANATASQARPETTTHITDQTREDNALYGPLIHVETAAWQDFHDDLQQQIAESYVGDYEDRDEAPTTPQQHYSSDESEDIGQNTATSAGDEPSMSFVSSFTSLSTDTMRPKRTRQSFSSPTQGSRFPKSRSRLTASQCSTDSPISTTKTKLSELDVPYCVETNACKGKICFQNPEGQEVNTELRDWKEGIVNGTQCLSWKSPKSGRLFWTKELPTEQPKATKKKGKRR